MKKLSAGIAANDGKGTKAPAAVAIFNDNVDEMERRFAELTASLSSMPVLLSTSADPVEIGGYGDSMWGYGAGGGFAAFLGTAKMLHHNANIRVHYQNPENGGHNYAVGGTTTEYMLDTQLPKIIAAYEAGTLPRVMWGSPLQNDNYFTPAQADAAIERCITFYSALLSRDRIVLSMGVHPKDGIGEATDNAYLRHYVERRLTEWSAKQPDMIYIPILDLLKSGDPTQEARGLINWKSGYSSDGTHSDVQGARAIAKRVADMGLRRIAPEAIKPAFDGTNYDQVRNVYGNRLGTQGRLVGTGGKINGVVSPNMPAGLELIYDAAKGLTITPALTGQQSRPLSLTASGVPTADVEWALRFTSNARLGSNPSFFIWGEVWWVNAMNWGGVGVTDGRLGIDTLTEVILPFPGAGSFGRSHIMPFELNEHVTFHSMAPFKRSNPDARALRYDVAGMFMQGKEPSGRLDIGFQGMFRTDSVA